MVSGTTPYTHCWHPQSNFGEASFSFGEDFFFLFGDDAFGMVCNLFLAWFLVLILLKCLHSPMSPTKCFFTSASPPIANELN